MGIASSVRACSLSGVSSKTGPLCLRVSAAPSAPLHAVSPGSIIRTVWYCLCPASFLCRTPIHFYYSNPLSPCQRYFFGILRKEAPELPCSGARVYRQSYASSQCPMQGMGMPPVGRGLAPAVLRGGPSPRGSAPAALCRSAGQGAPTSWARGGVVSILWASCRLHRSKNLFSTA